MDNNYAPLAETDPESGLAITQKLLAGAFVGLLIYDYWVWKTHGYEATISCFAKSTASKYPIAGVLFGVLVGHLFWPQPA